MGAIQITQIHVEHEKGTIHTHRHPVEHVTSSITRLSYVNYKTALLFPVSYQFSSLIYHLTRNSSRVSFTLGIK